MQVAKHNNIEKRIMFYWSKLYSQEIHRGEDYDVLQKTIVILIADFKLDKLNKIPKFHTKWQIREEEYGTIVLTDTLEIHIIELPKLLNQLENNPENKKEKIALWSMFLLNPEKIGEEDMKENEDIRKAKEELEKIRENEKDMRLAELRMKYILDQNSMRNSGYRDGFSEGLQEGLQEGLAKGEKNKQLEIAKKLLILKMTTEQIIEATGLTEEELNKIK